MKHDDFNAIVQDLLVETWGSRFYPSAQIVRMWSIVRDLSVGEFRFAIEQLNLSAIRAPSLGQVKTALTPALNRIALDKKLQQLAELNKKEPCRYCQHSGYVQAYKLDAPLIEYSFICPNCTAARLLGFKENHGMRVWMSAYLDTGYVIHFTDVASEKDYNRVVEEWQAKHVKKKVRVPILVDLATNEKLFEEDIPF